jgi:hypothetical protein
MQKRRADTVRLVERAEQAYAAKRYRTCAEEYLELAKRDETVSATASSNAARCYALLGDREHAFAALSQASRRGLSDFDAIAKDEDFASLRKDARWASLRGRHIDQALRDTLVKMGRDDQAERELALQGHPVVGHDNDRIQLLKQIIAEYGWPGISLVGEEAANAAWLVAQHADEDLAFQRQCLSLVEKAHAAGDATGMHLAYLTDRVFSAEGKQQLYGTQGAPQYSAQEKARVEARRKKLGLPSMAEMARLKAEAYERILRGR